MSKVKEWLLEQEALQDENTIQVSFKCKCGNWIKGYYTKIPGGVNDDVVSIVKCKECGDLHKVYAKNDFSLLLDTKAEIIKTDYV